MSVTALGAVLWACGGARMTIADPDATTPDADRINVIQPDTGEPPDPTRDPDHGLYPDSGNAVEPDAEVEVCDTPATFYRDKDGDGHGIDADTASGCEAPAGYVETAGDCDDENAAIFPEAPEICNEVDDNCNHFVDESFVKRNYFRDEDGDGFGGANFEITCLKKAGYVALSGDCADKDPTRYPGAPEQCNGIDDDCDDVVDNDLTSITSYRDDDGDGWAISATNSHVGCKVPAGPWVLARDADGDGEPDWDCDDSNTTVHPGAPTVCGDGIDNNCDGDVDRLCFTTCAGEWTKGPYKLPDGKAVLNSRVADLDGDGDYEIVVQDEAGFAILDRRGAALLEDSAPGRRNYGRGLVVLADIDNYDSFGTKNQTLEVLTANGNRPNYYRLNADGSVSVFNSAEKIYEFSRLMAADIDRDGVVEFFATTWNRDAASVHRFDRATGRIELVRSIVDPDGAHPLNNRRSLTDLDGDGTLDLVAGNGFWRDDRPDMWKGHINAIRFIDPVALTSTDYCPTGECFKTELAGLFAGRVAHGYLFRIGDEVRARVDYFESAEFGLSNPRTARYWRFGLDGQPQPGSPSTGNSQYSGTTDVDRDGTPEGFGWATAALGLFDVNGDGFPDRVHASGQGLSLSLWDVGSKNFSKNAGSDASVASTPLSVRSAWDIDGDGRLEVISSDQQSNVYCHQLGRDSWDRGAVLPPRFPLFQRTNQWDNYEPNEGTDQTGDGLPDEVVRVPSALTNRGDFYSYLSSADDKDYFLLNTGWNGQVCLTAPPVAKLRMRLYSFRDLWDNKTKALKKDGKPDGLFWSGDVAAGKTRCITPSNPHRYGEYKFVIGVESVDGSASPFWPYWIEARKR